MNNVSEIEARCAAIVDKWSVNDDFQNLVGICMADLDLAHYVASGIAEPKGFMKSLQHRVRMELAKEE